jgi:hypothetical protein
MEMRNLHFLLLMVPLLTSCATVDQVKLESNRATGYEKTIDRLFVVTMTGDLKVRPGASSKDQETPSVPFGAIIGDELKNQLGTIGMQVACVQVSGLELDTGFVDEQKNGYAADYTMTISRAGETIDIHHGGYTTVVGNSSYYVPTTTTTTTNSFDIRLFEESGGQLIWRSQVAVVGYLRETTAQEMVSDLLHRLAEDKLLDLKGKTLPDPVLPKTLTPGGSILIGAGVGAFLAIISQLPYILLRN